MNKKQLEKEVLRLKSVGLNKEQIKSVLTKSNIGTTKEDYKNYYKEGFNLEESHRVDDDFDFIRFIRYAITDLKTKDIISCNYSQDTSEQLVNYYAKFKYKGTLVQIKIEDKFTRSGDIILGSGYTINYNGYSLDYGTSNHNTISNDIFKFIECNNNLSLFTILRAFGYGVVDNFDTIGGYYMDYSLTYALENSLNFPPEKYVELINNAKGRDLVKHLTR